MLTLDNKTGSLGKIAGLNLTVLLAMTAIAAPIGILVTNAYNDNNVVMFVSRETSY